MVKYQPSLDRVFSALADPTRRAILTCLVAGPRTVGELAEPFEISPSGFSKHLRVLERAGLLRQHKRGRERFCEVLVEPLEEAVTWLERHREIWNSSLDAFAEYAEQLQIKRNPKRKK
ncbi:MAG: ArsR family transcriptional regulator [Planctomycetota bacterium]|nr:MAG: ArsR family transcriptional regulator [Planctomycetota bacterium]REJ92000.1 MAG: ArsR family transcriptional regulator [Planctomycetota bacterium]REK28536.1 MAG: ArsR family transcriptional regulator [Planctomycetota bacterium]REK39151.1 MAG: ArsR family transcriptional regulator [Planctomycetota bacterium]